MTGEKKDAGAFSSWLASMLSALLEQDGSEVPCGGCTACCSSSQFVHVGPDETDTFAHIPRELLFPAPRLPRGNVLMGYDSHGRCPMLVENRCTIYEHRPRTCRVYDCRVFAASGTEVGYPGKNLIADQVSSWEFQFPSNLDRIEFEAVRSAAQYLADHQKELGDLLPTTAATHRSLLAIQLHEMFLDRHRDNGAPGLVTPSLEAVRAKLQECAAR